MWRRHPEFKVHSAAQAKGGHYNKLLLPTSANQQEPLPEADFLDKAFTDREIITACTKFVSVPLYLFALEHVFSIIFVNIYSSCDRDWSVNSNESKIKTVSLGRPNETAPLNKLNTQWPQDSSCYGHDVKPSVVLSISTSRRWKFPILLSGDYLLVGEITVFISSVDQPWCNPKWLTGLKTPTN